MSDTVKNKKIHLPKKEARNYEAAEMYAHGYKGGPHRNRNEKRRNNPRNRWEHDHDV